MSETKIKSTDEIADHGAISEQIDDYMSDYADRPQSTTNGFHDGQNIPSGRILRVPNHGDPRKGVTRVIEVKREVDSQPLEAKIETFGFKPGGYKIGHVVSARTSDGKVAYSTSPFGPGDGYAGVSRKNGGENYTHNFNPENTKRAKALIGSLASKRAAKIVKGK